MANWISYIKDDLGTGGTTRDGMINDGPSHGIQLSTDLPPLTGITTCATIEATTVSISGNLKLDGQLKDGDDTFGSSGQVLSSDGTDTRWVNAGSLSAGAASQVAINDDSNTDAERFITFVDASSGNNSVKTDPQLKYNPNKNQLNFTATESGIKFGPGDATNDDAHIEWLGGSNAGHLRISTSDDGGTEYIQFGDYASQNKVGTFTEWLRIRRDTGTFTGTFSATTFSGSGASLTTLNASNLSSGTVNTARLPNTYTKAGQVVVQATGAGNDVKLDAADHILLEAGEEEDGCIFFRGNSGADSYRFSKGGQTAHEGFLSFESLGADRTFTFPDVTGTVALTSSDITGNAATATVLETQRSFSITGEITANSINFDGSGNVALSATIDNNIVDEANLKISNAGTNGQFLCKRSGNTGGMTWETVTVPEADTLSGSTLASGITASSITSLGTLGSLTVTNDITINDGVLNVGDGGDQSEIRIKKADNNVSDHLQFYNGTTRIGEIGCEDNTWLRINQETNKNIYTPRMFRADGGFQVDGDTVIDASGDIVASKVPTLNQNTTGTSGGFTAGNASNLNSGTIPDGRLAASSLFVSGMIMMWSGSTGSIPSGWVLCNGSNSTPNLRNRFVIGAGDDYSVDATGGSKNASVIDHTHNISHTHSHSHTHGMSHTHGAGSYDTDTQGNHQHTQDAHTPSYDSEDPGMDGWAMSTGTQVGTNNNVGNTTGNHTHDISGTSGGASSSNTGGASSTNTGGASTSNTGDASSGVSGTDKNLPPYYALCYIMKT